MTSPAGSPSSPLANFTNFACAAVVAAPALRLANRRLPVIALGTFAAASAANYFSQARPTDDVAKKVFEKEG